MSMYIVSNECLNDVANLLVKIYPYMDLDDVFKRILHLNISVWNNKYGEDVNFSEYLNECKIKDYSKYVYLDDCRVARFRGDYGNTHIIQLVESLRCYSYQIEENYINDILDRLTYSMIKELVENPLIVEIHNYIRYFDLENHNCRVSMVEWDRGS